MSGSNRPLRLSLLLEENANAMSGDEFEDEVKAIQGRHEKPRILYKSRSIKATVYVGNSPVDFMVPFQRVDEAIDKARSLSDGTGYEQALLDKLLYARQLYSYQIKGRNAPRGGPESRGIVVSIQYAAAWTYFLLSELERCEILNSVRDSLLNAERLVAALVPGWATSYTRAQQLWLITAFLVDKCFRQERRAGGLDSPVEFRERDHSPQSFYVTYIVPRLEWVKKHLAKDPHLFDFARAEPLRPAPNMYLRRVFAVLSRLKENRQDASGPIKG